MAALWVGLAAVLGSVTDDLGALLIGDRVSPVSSSSAVSILSALGTGMITFTGMVFSILFVVLQFGSSAYSPRLVRELGRHASIIGNAFGVFTGTFVYALLAIRTVDIAGRQGANTAVLGVALVWLLGSIFMFLRLVSGIQTLAVTRTLMFLDRAARAAIARTSRVAAQRPAPPPAPAELPPVSQMVRHPGGGPQSIQLLDVDALVAVARDAGGIVMIPHAVGDLVSPGAPLALVLGGARQVSERRLRRAIVLGPDRAIYGDPPYALRLMVDIAIRALSPAVNDPTTAVQALDRIEGLLLVLGRAPLDAGHVADRDGQLRLIHSSPTWEDVLLLALIEIQQYGQESIQVQRRIRALLQELDEQLPAPRRPAVRAFMARHQVSLPARFRSDGWIPEASACDRQGLGHTSEWP